MSKRVARAPSLYEPYLLFLIFVGVGLGTVLVEQKVRLALLWTTMILLSVLYRSKIKVDTDFGPASISRGALLGIVISMPILAFLISQLRVFTERLYATSDVVMLFYQICFVSAPVEEYFFRGIIQGRYGSSVSTTLYAATALLYFLPHAPLLVSFIVFVAMGTLGLVYGFVRERHGLAASIACHVVVGLILQVIPSMIEALRVLLVG
ncbi:MAG: CPBP family intramembrane metalloprotease [Chloroflexi bacterium]|jgi:membrane protease YdiL (CAAX protease family)|nr:CPBP family intramembrane metalloprotease [Chloroflexota bacterium]